MKRAFTLLVLALVLSIPMISAQTLSVQQFSGTQGVRNVAKTTDTLTIKALITIPNDNEITPNQVRLVTSEGISYVFESCVQQPGGALCTLTYELVGQGGVDDYTVAAFDDDGVEVKQSIEPLVNDFVNPEMQALSTDKEILGAGSIALSYRAEDYAFSPGDTSACAGVGSVKIYENTASAGYKATIPGTTQVNDCSIEGTFQYTPVNTGNVTICAVAFDRLGKTSPPLCTKVYVDRAPPQFKNYRFFAADGTTVFTIPPEGMTVGLEVLIDDPSLDVNSVSADFTRIAGVSGIGPNDIGAAGHRIVVWNNIHLSSVSPCEFSVKASDDLGNTLNQKFTCAITSDTSPPEAVSMTTGFTSDDGTPLLGIMGDLQISFNEKGMARSDAFIDTDGLGLGRRKAAYCAPEGVNWVCHWNLPANVPAGRYSVTALTDTMDDLGNHLAQETTYAFDYDPTIPEVTGGPHVRVFHSGQDYGDKIVNSDTLEITYNTSGVVSAIANFSDIGGGLASGSCDENTCTFSQDVQRSGGYEAVARMKFLDSAGNYVEKLHKFTVFEVLDEPNPNYWKSVVSCTPKTLDRASTVLVNHQVYCQVKLIPFNNSKKIDVAATGLGALEQCTGDFETSVAGVDLINNGYLSRTPYLRVLLQTREYPEAQFNLTCPVQVFTKIGDGFTSFAEVENVTMKIAFGDSSMGTLAQGIDDKIDEAMDDVDRFGSWLDSLKKFFEYAEKVCQLRQMYWNIMAAFDTIHSALVAADIIADSYPPADAAVAANRAFWCETKENYKSILGGRTEPGTGIDGILRPFCNFVNCNGFAGGLVDFNYGGITSGQPTAGTPGTPGVVDVRDSIIWSVATLCVPGIIYNVDKYRQIQCSYATCLKRDVKQFGVPLSVCDDEKAYLSCTYFWGQAFAAIPYVAIVDFWIGTVKEWIANPFAALAALVGAFCESQCGSKNGITNAVCSVAKVAEVLGKVIDDVTAIKDENFFKVGQGPCNTLKELEDEE